MLYAMLDKEKGYLNFLRDVCCSNMIFKTEDMKAETSFRDVEL